MNLGGPAGLWHMVRHGIVRDEAYQAIPWLSYLTSSLKIINFVQKQSRSTKFSKTSKKHGIMSKNHHKNKKSSKTPVHVPRMSCRNTFSTFFLIILQLPWLTLKFNQSKSTIRIEIMTTSMNLTKNFEKKPSWECF